MGGGLIQLVSQGFEDLYLTTEPEVTFFKRIYKRHTNFSLELIPQLFNTIPDFGKRITCNLSKNADLLIHEGHFSPKDLPLHREWGHSSWVEAVKVAKSSNSKRLIMTHHAPDYEDTLIAILESDAQKSFQNSSFSRSEETIYLN